MEVSPTPGSTIGSPRLKWPCVQMLDREKRRPGAITRVLRFGAMAGGGGGGGALAAGGGGVKEALQCWEWLVTQWPGPARHLHLRI
eukprot:scaffold37331_cov16-Tisochrysis_lutea.AAC.1